MHGLHSPFGIIGQLKEKRGLTHAQVLWGQSWVLFLLESADAPRYIRGKKPLPEASTQDIIKIANSRKNR